MNAKSPLYTFFGHVTNRRLKYIYISIIQMVIDWPGGQLSDGQMVRWSSKCVDRLNGEGGIFWRKRRALDASGCLGLAPGNGHPIFLTQRRRTRGRFSIFVEKCRLAVDLSNQKQRFTDGFKLRFSYA